MKCVEDLSCSCMYDAILLLWQVSVFLGDENVTSQFRHHTQLVMGDGAPGLQPVYYAVEMSQEALVIDYSYHEKTLSCRASLRAEDVPETLNSSLVHVHSNLNITLLCE